MSARGIILSISAVLIILIILTFFKDSFFYQNKLIITLAIAIQGLILIYSSTFTKQRLLSAIIGLLFLILGALPLAIGFQLLPTSYDIAIPSIGYQIVAIFASLYTMLVLLQKSANKKPQSI